MTLILSQTVRDKMFRHAVEDYPDECCGFMLGREGENREVTELRRVENTREGNRRRRFQIDPSDYQKAEKEAFDRELDLLGVYHSHPDHPAEPSEHDRRSALPWFSYVIVSVNAGSASRLRSWRLDEDRNFQEEPVEIHSTANELHTKLS